MLSLLGPVNELDAQLEGALGMAQEIILIKTKALIKQLDRGDGGFTNADHADVLGFNQADPAIAAQGIDQSRRRHPSGGAAADNSDMANFTIIHSGVPSSHR